MQGYYNILDTLKASLIADVNVNTVSQGDIFDVDLKKQTIFPLSHIMVDGASKEGSVFTFNISVICMDVMDENPIAATDSFRGNDNELDILNTQFNVAATLVESLERGDLYEDKYVLNGNASFEFFTERFENKLAGVVVTFAVNVPTDVTVC